MRTATTEQYIDGGRAVAMWHGITAAHLLRRCAQARAIGRDGDADRMAHVASLMHAGEPITEREWCEMKAALHSVEAALVAAHEAAHGPCRLNRHGQPHGGCHPALA